MDYSGVESLGYTSVARNYLGLPYGVQVSFNAIGTLFDTPGYRYQCNPCYFNRPFNYLSNTLNALNGAPPVYAATYGTFMNSTSAGSLNENSWDISGPYGCNANQPSVWVMLGGFTDKASSYVPTTFPQGTCVWPCILVGAWGRSDKIFTKTTTTTQVASNDINWYYVDQSVMGFSPNGTKPNIVAGYDRCGYVNVDNSGKINCGNPANNYYSAYRLSWLLDDVKKQGGARLGPIINLQASTSFYKMAYMCTFLPSGQPTSRPSRSPSMRPSSQPSSQPSSRPSSSHPTMQPSGQPSREPSSQPSSQPSSKPSSRPSSEPTGRPSSQPSSQPSREPSTQPSDHPSDQPTKCPSGQPTNQPSGQPSTQPTVQPFGQPTTQPTRQPTGQPSRQPFSQPTAQPSDLPTAMPTYRDAERSQSFKSYNYYAFAVIGEYGNVKTWGDPKGGGDSRSVRDRLESGVAKVVGTKSSFMALKSNGEIVTWGTIQKIPNHIYTLTAKNVVNVVPNENAFATLLSDGSVVAYGHALWGGNLSLTYVSYETLNMLQSGVASIRATSGAFCALKSDGTIVTWGKPTMGGSIRHVKTPELSIDSSNFTAITKVYANRQAFAARNVRHEVLTWGNPIYGGEHFIPKISEPISATATAFACLRFNRSVVTWGFGPDGANTTYRLGGNVIRSLINVRVIVATDSAFAALRLDGRVIVWGDPDYGGFNSDAVRGLRTAKEIYSNGGAFVVKETRGKVAVAWGDAEGGGSIPPVIRSKMSNGVSNVYNTWRAFAALKSDGSVYAWGNTAEGGNFPLGLNGVSFICSNHVAFLAVREPPALSVSWGLLDYGGNTSTVNALLRTVNVTRCAL